MEKRKGNKKPKILLAGHKPADEKEISAMISDKYELTCVSTEEQVLQILQDNDKEFSGAIFSQDKALELLE